MNKEKFLDDFEKLNSPVKIIGELTNWKNKVECECLLCGEHFYMALINLKRGSIHSKCSYILRGQKKKDITASNFEQKLKSINPDIEAIEKYQKALIPLKVKCKVCGNIWEATPNNLLSGHGCPNCFNKIKKGKLPTDKLEEYISKILIKFQDLEFVKKSNKVNGQFTCKCKKCNFIWTTTLYNLSKIKENNCCPSCTGRSLDLRKLNNILKEKELKLDRIPQKYSDNVHCTCLKCGFSWNTKITNIFKIKGCIKCTNRLKKTNEDFLKEINENNIQVELLSPYINSSTKIKRKCLLCGDISSMLPHDIMSGNCKTCAAIRMHDYFAKSQEEFISDFKNKYGDAYEVISNYKNRKTKVVVKHNICNRNFLFIPANIYNKTICICPYCYNKNSNGERILEKFFQENGIKYNLHKTFDDLRGINNGHLSYDFYLQNQNLLIEYQGIQHYQPVKAFGGDAKFQVQQEHDKRKRQYAFDNNFKLLEIPYWDYDNIEEIISTELNIAS